MSKPQDLETLTNPPERPNPLNPEFIEFGNGGMKVEEPEIPYQKKERKRLCFHIDKDIDDAIEKEVRSRRSRGSKTQWIVKAILTRLRWKDKIPPI